MRILVVGDGHSAIHEVAVVRALSQLGHEVQAFYWHSYFGANYVLARLWRRAQNRFLVGPALSKLNDDLVSRAVLFQPALIFIYRGTHVYARTLARLKRKLPDCQIFGYNNDDPFAKGHPPRLWQHFLRSIPFYDLVFAYRKHNLAEYTAVGAKRVLLLMPWFIPEKDTPLVADGVVVNRFDVVFVGHYENDHRVEYLGRIAESAYSFGLFGPDWDRAPSVAWLNKYYPVRPLCSDLYRETLSAAKIALCFLSTLNRDTYTRRCFEIPAMGVFMLCEYSYDLSKLFEDGVDAVFFHNPQDMMRKIEYYLEHEAEREAIAKSGYVRVNRDRHDVISRMAYVCACVEVQ